MSSSPELPNLDAGLFHRPDLERLHPAERATHPPRILLLYGSLRERSYSRLLTEEAVELLTTPLDLSGYKVTIMEAMVKGTARHVESEEEPSKNAPVGQATKSCLPD
mgnify:CR=1 FL=1